MVPFIKELGYTGKFDMLSEIHTDQMHQPWRTFVDVINRCISRNSTSLDRLRPSRAQILWEMFYQKNVDYVALLWEDFMFQAENKDISLAQDYQKCGALIPDQMINQAIQDSKDYKTNLVFATGEAAPKKARKFKKISSPSKTQTLVLEEEPTKKPKRAKKAETTKETAISKKSSTMQIAGVVIKDTPALLKAAQLEKVLKKSKKDTHMLHASGSGDRFGSQPKVPDELQDNTIDTNKGTSTKLGVPNVSKDQSESKNES
ncbi:hypothetical protein Tco_1418831 [Tanacetum coccineum]